LDYRTNFARMILGASQLEIEYLLSIIFEQINRKSSCIKRRQYI
jgi:hypothetical protein